MNKAGSTCSLFPNEEIQGKTLLVPAQEANPPHPVWGAPSCDPREEGAAGPGAGQGLFPSRGCIQPPSGIGMASACSPQSPPARGKRGCFLN